MSIGYKNNVRVVGSGVCPLVFVHGFGCDQNVWARLVPHFTDDYRVVLYDQVGSGRSDLSAYDESRYRSLDAYANDLLALCDAYELERPIVVGHSVGATIAMLAAIDAPDRFGGLAMIAPNPCYINDGDYEGGFERADVDELLDLLDSNYLGWTSTMAKVLMQHAERADVEAELTNSFCRTDPDIARHFARVTFLSDHRGVLPRLRTPSLLLQTQQDVVAPLTVGEYMHAHLPDSELVRMQAIGHCPHLSAPEETAAHVRRFLAGGSVAGSATRMVPG